MNFEDLKNPVLQEKLKSAKNAEELLTLVKGEGMELSDDQFDAISGGEKWYQCDCYSPGTYNSIG